MLITAEMQLVSCKGSVIQPNYIKVCEEKRKITVTKGMEANS
jgi:hypothetical protein